MLSIIKLADAEYAIGQVALGIEEYYLGEGEAPGVWAGRWAATLGLEGVVEADQLRRLVNGIDPGDGTDLLAERPRRKVNAFDVTFSAPKSVSLLWAFGSPEVASIVSRAHVEAVAEALALLEGRAAVSRQQTDGVRTRVGTGGWAVATFQHRTSRAGDPQLHTHCVVPNVVCRVDGSYATLDGAVLYRWGKPAGSVYQEQLRRILTDQLGVEWGPDRNGTREMLGFTPAQLRRFSKRTAQIDAYLERSGGVYQTASARMRADHLASLATRPDKDRTLTPERLRDGWADEAASVCLDRHQIDTDVIGRTAGRAPLVWEELVVALCDPETGLCANDSRFGEADVIQHVAAVGAGRLTVSDIERLAGDFLASLEVVRLGVDPEEARRTPPQWTTRDHLVLESIVLDCVDALVERAVAYLDPQIVRAAVDADRLGDDQAAAVGVLCAAGPALRTMIAPAGFGKTTAVHAAAVAAARSGHPVLGVATTNRAVAELCDVGIPAVTIARLAIDLQDRPLAPGTVVIMDETSQTATVDARVVLDVVCNTGGARLWCLGDVRQTQAVRAGGLAAELDRLATEDRIPAAVLSENRRQTHPAERHALAAWRNGDLAASQAIRAGAGLEHEHETPSETREAMADAVTADIIIHGPWSAVALAVSHADCEDLADRIRDRLVAAGPIAGPAVTGPGWGTGQRSYQAGDLILLHTNLRLAKTKVANGTTLTVTGVTDTGLAVSDRHGANFTLPAVFVAGLGRAGRPNVSHAWCRTVDGAQGGTWDRAHLLGSAAVDNFSAYVGQSRARATTHTWNVAAIPAGDWGGRLVDQRSGAERFLDGAARQPTETFAAHDDPSILDRQLSAEINAHHQIINTAPQIVRCFELDEARQRHEGALAEVVSWEHQLAYDHRTTPRRGMGAANRREREISADAISRHTADLQQAQQAAQRAADQLAALLAAGDARRAWEQRDGWRIDAVAGLQGRLDDHWAEVVFAAVVQDDPLAYGIDRLRQARRTVTDQLGRLDKSLPPDQSDQLLDAQRHLHRRQEIADHAAKRHAEAERALARVSGRSGRKQQPQARQRLAETAKDLLQARAALVDAERDVTREQAAVDARTHAQAATTDERHTLEARLISITYALDQTRAERVDHAADGHHVDEELVRLGPPPADQAGQAAWAGLADRITLALDRTERRSWLDWSNDPVDRLVLRLLKGDEHTIGHVQTVIAGAEQTTSRSSILNAWAAGRTAGIDHSVDVDLGL